MTGKSGSKAWPGIAREEKSVLRHGWKAEVFGGGGKSRIGPRPFCGRSHSPVLQYLPVTQIKMGDLAEIDVTGIPGAGGAEMLINRLVREVAALRIEVGQLKALIRMPDSFSRDEAEKLLNKAAQPQPGQAPSQPIRRIETPQQEAPRRRRTKKKPSAQPQAQRPSNSSYRITGSLE